MSDYFFVNVDKPRDWTSFDVVAKTRKQFERGTKVGHLGTLDPFATGVLPLAIGKATKLIQYLQDLEKVYEAEVRLGATSTTLDPEGEITELHIEPLELSFLEGEIKNLIGEIDQVPPKFSALKIDGKRAYDLARAGRDFDMQSRKVSVYDIEIIDYTWPVLNLRITCGKGVYIRSIARDLGGYLTNLRRTKVGIFMEANFNQQVSIREAWTAVDRQELIVTEQEWQELNQGRFIEGEIGEGDVVLGICEGVAIGLLESAKDVGMIKLKATLV